MLLSAFCCRKGDLMEDLMLYTKNYFYRWKEYGTYAINNSQIACRGQYKVGQYVRIIGSVFNDGVHEIHSVTNNTITINNLRNEEFKGYICGLAVPKEFYDLVQDIKAYRLKHMPNLGMQSESFAGPLIQGNARGV